MWGHIDGAQIEQALVDAAKTPVKSGNRVGLFWSKHGMIWVLEKGAKEKRYVGALRLKKKTLSPDIYKRLARGLRVIMQFNPGDDKDEEEEARCPFCQSTNIEEHFEEGYGHKFTCQDCFRSFDEDAIIYEMVKK
jgi:hypothetical protein